MVHILNATLCIYILHPKRLLGAGNTLIGQVYGAALLIYGVIALNLQGAGHLGHVAVNVLGVLCRRGDNKRRARLVYQNRVDLVYNSKVVAALPELFRHVGNVVAQVVKAKLAVGAIGNVGLIGLAARCRAQKLVHDMKRAYLVYFFVGGLALRSIGEGGVVAPAAVACNNSQGHTKRCINLTHPHRVAACQVVVNGNNVHALCHKRI